MKVGQAPRAEPRSPGAALAYGPPAHALARSLLAGSDSELGRLRAVTGPELLVVLGVEADLPWVDGLLYLAREPNAPELWLPSAVEPDVPAPLLARALTARFAESGVRPPFAVSLEPPRVVPLYTEQPLDRALLERWQKAQAP